MPFNKTLADRIADTLQENDISFVEKKMFGGLCFMVNGKMCIGVEKDRMMARIGEEAYEDALRKDGCTKMDFTGRPLKGFVYVSQDALDDDTELGYWIQLCLEYNPKAKSSKKKKRT